MRGAPGWTAVVMGVLLGLLVGAGWMLARERQVQAQPQAAGEQVGAANAGGPIAAVDPAEPEGDLDEGLHRSRRTAIVRATEMVSPAVVSINVISHVTYRTPTMELFERFYPGIFRGREYQRDVQGLGSGVVVSHEGLVLTNWHVVEGADEIIATLTDGRQFPAKLLEKVEDYDLALLKIEGEDLPVARMATADDLQIGEWVIAIGSPFGYLLADTQPTVTVGVISALRRDIKQMQNRTYLGMIQTDASINPGNSGGPLVNANGEVIGINTFIFTESGGSIGIGFAVPIKRAQWLISEVERYGRWRRATSGLVLQQISANMIRALGVRDAVGFVILEVAVDSPAWKAGLRAGDILRSLNGVRLESRDTVIRLLYEAQVGTRVTFEAERDNRGFEGTMVLEEAPESAGT